MADKGWARQHSPAAEQGRQQRPSARRGGGRAMERDQRSEMAKLQQLRALANDSQRVQQLRRLQALAQGPERSAEAEPTATQAEIAKPKPNLTGLPDRLKSNLEALSGLSMEAVRVHYNSTKPAQLNALAYAQGTDIHLGPGQEQHLPHEAWHVVQQAQGRVRPTMQMAGGVAVNDDKGLEREADVMGGRAVAVCPLRQFQGRMEWTGIPAQRQLTEGQDKDEPLYLPPLHGLPQHIAYNNAAYSTPIQLIREKLGWGVEKYKKQTMTTVFLFALLDGQDLGIFSSNNGNHAEDNLIAKINGMKSKDELKNSKKLVIYLSTSPCSSVYGTCKEAGRDGCQEKLQKLQEKLGLTIEVKADHLYQPLSTGEGMKNSGYPVGFSSLSAAATSQFPVSVSHLPKSLADEKMLANENVAQLHPASCHIKTSCMEPALCLQNQT